MSAIATNTLLELVRLKVFYFLLLFALLLIGSSAFLVDFTFQEQFQVLKDVSLGAMSIFSWLLGVLATAMLLPKDIEDRTLYTILAKPVPRFEYLLGKLAGVLLMLLVAIALMCVGFVIVLYVREQSAIRDAVSSTPQAELQAAIDQIRNSTFSNSLAAAVVAIYIKAALCAALTLLVSTFASSWIFTVIVSTMIYFIGHIQSVAREHWLSGEMISPVKKVFLSLIALFFPDLQLFNLADDIVAGNAIALSIFLKTAGLGVIYTVVYLLLAQFIFSKKEL